MPTELPLTRHLEGLRAAMVAFVRYADRAGMRAPVPTCPEWTVRDLVVHQGMVHRWAAALVRGENGTDPDAVEAEGRAEVDPLEWLRDGVIELAETLTRAPADATALVFLNDAPAPREFWARRQCHETTIHAVDALAAALGRHPLPADTWIEPDVAVDGIDELLGGFLTRPRSQLRCEERGQLVVAPDDVPDWWLVEVGPGPAATSRRAGPRADGDWVLAGTAVDLYLSLWNRTARASLEGTWRERAAVTWT
ncbi:maleylpyruvate isomerase family mycothiol-dependent enzyme [Nocardioides caricicola]|uniref:Maleylpyruvate isomerase family mycothiol-dependent enzyme n=1 Tax=Nocardioides caricicola TaxID=634770 RepID=A0ABW0MZX3_9ACTN